MPDVPLTSYSMVGLLDRGLTEFEEVGPGNVLSKLMARIRKAR